MLANKDDSDDDMNFGNNKEEEKNEESSVEINNVNDGYYEEGGYRASDKRRVFELEIFWNKDRPQAATHKLDRCKKHENFSQIIKEADQLSSEEITLMQ